MGHIGLTPQAINTLGKVRVQGKNREQARQLLADALAVQEAGAFAVVLELVPEQLAAAITERLRIPTIGIGAGAGCSGQIQVINDTLGYGDWTPKHARRYADLRGTILGAVAPVPGRRRGRHVPGRGRDRAHGRGRPGRGPRAARRRLTGPGRACRSPASRSTATSSRFLARPLRTRSRPPRGRSPTGDLAAPVGLVPTMGWLHAGHVSLVERARAESATVVMSIFVNPKQFGEASDFEQLPAQRGARPRDGPRRRAWTSCSRRPWTRSTRRASTRRCPSGRSPGRSRAPRGPGHFDGVATVVAILFALVGAERAYFGLKDYQQVRVIRADGARPRPADDGRARARPSASRTAWRCRRATRGSRPRVAPRRRSSGGRCSPGRPRSARGERTGDAVRATMRDVLATEPRARPTTSRVADADTLAELETSTARRCCRSPCRSTASGSSTTSASRLRVPAPPSAQRPARHPAPARHRDVGHAAADHREPDHHRADRGRHGAAGNTAARPHAAATRPARIPPTMIPMANAVLENRACAVARSVPAPAGRRTSSCPRGTARSPCRRAPRPSTRPIALPVTANSSARTTKIAAPDDEQPLDAEAGPRAAGRRASSGSRAPRWPPSRCPTSRASPPSSMSRRLKNAMIPGRRDPHHDRPGEEQAQARVAEQAERPDRPDAGDARRRASPAPGPPPRRCRSARAPARTRRASPACGRLDEHADGEGREDEPERPERPRLSEPVSVRARAAPPSGHRRAGSGPTTRPRGPPRRAPARASAAGARAARRRTRPTARRRGAAAGRRRAGRRPGPTRARRRSRRPPARPPAAR